MSEMTHRITIRVSKDQMPALRERAKKAGFDELAQYIRLRCGIKYEDGRKSRAGKKARK